MTRKEAVDHITRGDFEPVFEALEEAEEAKRTVFAVTCSTSLPPGTMEARVNWRVVGRVKNIGEIGVREETRRAK